MRRKIHLLKDCFCLCSFSHTYIVHFVHVQARDTHLIEKPAHNDTGFMTTHFHFQDCEI